MLAPPRTGAAGAAGDRALPPRRADARPRPRSTCATAWPSRDWPPPMPFSQGARCSRSTSASRGVPRRINLLADRALLGAYADGVARVDQAHRRQGGRRSLRRRSAPAALRPGSLRPLGRRLGAGRRGAGRSHRALVDARTGTRAARAPRPRRIDARSVVRRRSTVDADHARASAPIDGTAPTPPSAAPAASVAPLFLTAATVTRAFANPLRSEVEAWRELAPLWGNGRPEAPTGIDPCTPAPPSRGNASSVGQRRLAAGPPARSARHHQPARRRRPTRRMRCCWASPSAADAAHRRARRGRVAGLAGRPVARRLRHLLAAPDGLSSVRSAVRATPAVDALAAQLAASAVSPRPPPPARRRAMKTRVQAFQLAQGLKPDGRAGPTTLMQLTRVTAAPGTNLACCVTHARSIALSYILDALKKADADRERDAAVPDLHARDAAADLAARACVVGPGPWPRSASAALVVLRRAGVASGSSLTAYARRRQRPGAGTDTRTSRQRLCKPRARAPAPVTAPRRLAPAAVPLPLLLLLLAATSADRHATAAAPPPPPAAPPRVIKVRRRRAVLRQLATVRPPAPKSSEPASRACEAGRLAGRRSQQRAAVDHQRLRCTRPTPSAAW